MTGLSTVKQSLLKDCRLAVNARLAEERGEKPPPQVFHRVLMGNPGTGKTTLARLYARFLYAIGAVANKDFLEVRPPDLKGQYIGQTAKSVIAKLDEAEGKVLFIDEAYAMADTKDPFYVEMVDTIVGQVHGTPKDRQIILMAGYSKEMRDMFDRVNPGLKRRMQLDNAFVLEDYTDAEMDLIIRRTAQKDGFSIDRPVVAAAVAMLAKMRQRPHFGNVGEINNLLMRAERAAAQREGTGDAAASARMLLDVDFLDATERGAGAEAKTQKNLERVDDYPDIKAWRDRVQRRLERQRTRRGASNDAEDWCFVFQGNPGTGKTTGARLIGDILCHTFGVLSSGHLEECSVTDLQTGFVGQAGGKVVELLQRSLGGVLFIDEAYRLNDGGQAFGRQVLDELCDRVTKEEFRGKVAVVLAGYDAQMQDLLKMNPGLSSRFSQVIRFRDFTPEQCTSMFVVASKKRSNQLDLDDGDLTALAVGFERVMAECSDWANGRDVHNLVKRCEEGIEHDGPWSLSDVEGIMEEFAASRPRKAASTANASEPPKRAFASSSSTAPPPLPSRTATDVPPPPPAAAAAFTVEKEDLATPPQPIDIAELTEAEEAEAEAFGGSIQGVIDALRLNARDVAKQLARGMLPPEIEAEFSRRGLSRSDLARLLKLHVAMIQKRRRLLKIKFCTICGRTHCPVSPVEFDVEVDE